MNNYYRLFMASQILNLSPETMVIAKKYKPFIHRTSNKKITYFDVDGYLKYEKNRKKTINNAKLLLEFLVYEKKFKYTQIAKILKVNHNTLTRYEFGLVVSENLINMFQQDYEDLIIEFEKFDKTILHHFIK